MFAYCENNPVNRLDKNGHAGSPNENQNGNGIPDYLEDRWRQLTLKTKQDLLMKAGYSVVIIPDDEGASNKRSEPQAEISNNNERCKHVDLDNADEGVGFWGFIWRAVEAVFPF